MSISDGSVRVSAMIDIEDDTDMSCLVGTNGEVELRLGGNAGAYLYLTASGANKLMRTLGAARGQ